MFARKVKLFEQLIFLRLICMDHAIDRFKLCLTCLGLTFNPCVNKKVKAFSKRENTCSDLSELSRIKNDQMYFQIQKPSFFLPQLITCYKS